MIASFVAALALQGFCPAQPWSLGFAAPPRIGLAGDVDGDGFSDMIVVSPVGDAFIDLSLTVDGQKSGPGFTGLSGWGQNCQAAAIGEIDESTGADIIGIFNGKNLRLAGGFADGRLKDTQEWYTLPKQLSAPSIACLNGGKEILAFSTKNGAAYRIDTKPKSSVSCSVPSGLIWIGDAGEKLVGKDRSGSLFWIDKSTFKLGEKLGEESKGSKPAAANGIVSFGDEVWIHGGVQTLSQTNLPIVDTMKAIADFDNDGDPDIIEYRLGRELHSGNQILLYRNITPGEKDSDHDGLSDSEEKQLGTDPFNPDTDNDALLDGWEVKGFRGLDFKQIGCSPTHTDMVCLISRFSQVNEDKVKSEMARVTKFYSDLKTPNPDGKTGFSFHPVYLAAIEGDDQKNAWWTNRDKFRPEKWRGVVHWMQVTPGGGGQADELGDGGSVAENALWAVFVHEFGHQNGMNHEGFWPNSLCPIYTSLMNYAYSYSFEDSGDKIHYSDGSLASYVLRETDLDEEIPLPYDRVKFLEKGPYRFRLKPNGKTTFIDWNWNGVFGEKHIRADINYSYSTNAGRRDDIGKTQSAPFLFVHQGRAFALYGQHDFPPDVKTDPSVSPDKPGRLMLKRLKKPFEWDQPWNIESGGLTGDPVAVSFSGKAMTFYQTSQGVMLRRVDVGRSGLAMSEPEVVSSDKSLVPTVGVYQNRLYLFLWNPVTNVVSYKVMDSTGKFVLSFTLDQRSTDPVGLCVDTITGEAVIGLTQDQGGAKTHRLQVRRYTTIAGSLIPGAMEWVEGPSGASRGSGRITVLFDSGRDAGPAGRIYLFCKGLTSKDSPWSCSYVAHQIADRSIHGGWLVKRFYDEWTQTRSAPAAAWFDGDIIWAYRWVAGDQSASDNTFHVGYKALGIQAEPMGDHDDLTFLRTWGIRNSLLSLSKTAQ